MGAAHARLARVQAERANLRTLQQAGTRREWHEAHREGQMEEVGIHGHVMLCRVL